MPSISVTPPGRSKTSSTLVVVAFAHGLTNGHRQPVSQDFGIPRIGYRRHRLPPYAAHFPEWRNVAGAETLEILLVDLAGVELRCGCCDQLFLVLSKHIEGWAEIDGDLLQKDVTGKGSYHRPIVLDGVRDMLLIRNVCRLWWWRY